MNRKLSWLSLAAAIWVLAACSSGNSSSPAAAPPPAAPPPPPAAKISGAVVDAFVVNATITAYEVSAAGAIGVCVPTASGACTTATTDANGNFSITITGYSGPVLLQATGGTYTDTVTGQTLPIPSSLTLSVLEPAVTAGNTYTDQMTGLTTMIADQALSMMSAGQSATAALAAATAAIQTQFGVENPAVTAILDLGQANCGTAATDQASFDVSLILAGVAQLASQFNVSSADLTAALVIDYRANGGVFRGTLPGGAAIPVGSQAVPLSTIEGSGLGVSLYQAVKTYIASVQNLCGASESAANAAALTANMAESAAQACTNSYYCYLVNINYSGPPGVILGFGLTFECSGDSSIGVPNGFSSGVNVGGSGMLSGQAESAALTAGQSTGNFVDSCTNATPTTTMSFTTFANALQTASNQGVTCTFSGPVTFSTQDSGYHNTATSTETVVCTLPTYTVSGTVSGLGTGSLTISDSVNGDSVVLNGNGPFALSAALANGASYNVQAMPSSSSEQCAVSNGSGTIAAASVTNVAISCSTAGGGGSTPAVFVIDSTSTLYAFDVNGVLLAQAALTTPVNNLNGGGITTVGNTVYVAVGATANGPIDRTPGAVVAFTFNGTALTPLTLPAGSFSNVNTPRGLVYDAHNQQFYIGNGGSSVTIYNATGGYLSDITKAVYGPSGVAYDSVDNTIWVANDTNGYGGNPTYGISEFNEQGTLAQTIDPATQFLAPIQPTHVLPYSIGYCAPGAGGSAVVAVGFLQDNINQDPQGTVGVSEGGVYSLNGTLLGAFSPQLAATAQPNAISCSSTGSIYVAANDGLHIYSTAGTAIAIPSGGFTGLTAPLFGVYANY